MQSPQVNVLKGRRLIFVFALALFHGHSSARAGEIRSNEIPVSENVRTRLQVLFEKYYPNAVVTKSKSGSLRFEYEVAKFEDPPSTGPKGAKHASSTRYGPTEGGISCGVSAYRGRFNGPFSPQIKKYKEYNLQLMAPYSSKEDSHLWVTLAYPPDASEEFLKEFRAIMSNHE